MKILFLSNSDIKQALPYQKLIPQMKKAMIDKSSENVVHPQRFVLPLSQGNALGFMPGFVPRSHSLGFKIASVFPGNKKHSLDAHQGLVVLLDPIKGSPEAVLNASQLTTRRTAAMSAAATDTLAKADASCLAIFGFGTQAREHIDAIRTVRNIKQLKIFSRSPTEEPNFGLNTLYSRSIEETLESSDIACLCTSSRSAYLTSKELPEGIHVNAVGACRPGHSEITIEKETHLKLLVDDRQATDIEADEIRFIKNKKSLQEIGEIFANPKIAESLKSKKTLFKSVGLAIQDVYAAQLALQEARALNLGVEVLL